MEFQKKARKDQLCILIYVLLIFVCSTLNFAYSFTPTTSLSTTIGPQSSPLSPSSHSLSKPPKPSSQSLTLSTQHVYNSTIQNISAAPPPAPLQAAGSVTTTATSSSNSTSVSPTTSQPKSSNNNTERNRKVCPGVHIRNDLKSFEQLKGCTVIDGPLTIALVSDQMHPYEPKDFENITFPDLKEITEYLLFFRVQGLTHLSTLFPNLAVIRGRELVANYALIIYEMMHLQKVALPKLNDILRGSVRIESNPNLCYLSTVNWEAICKHGFVPHFIRDNNARCNNNRCPDNCRPWTITSTRGVTSLNTNELTSRFVGDVYEFGAENNRSLYCWSNQVCQESCQNRHWGALPLSPNNSCCSPQCAGGCYKENRADRCIACRYVLQGDFCVEHCDNNLFEFKGECIGAQECEKMAVTTPHNNCGNIAPVTSNFKAIRLHSDRYGGRCQVDCPPGFEEDATNKHKCRPCDKGKCRKVCTPQDSDKPFMVTNVNSLRELSGCNVINGSLEISLKGGKNVLHELESVFQELEEIKGYLKITRSYPISTLSFLRSLKSINGSELDRGQYSLVIIDNPNLEELFLLNSSDSNQQKRLKILGGTVFAHLNPKLCPNRIEALKTYASVKEWDERDVSIHTNGDKEACNTIKLFVEFVQGTARLARIRFANYASQMDDPRSLLYYLINYRELPSGTTTMFDGRDGCNSQNDVWQTVEEAPIKLGLNNTDEYQTAIIPVQPATRYALYVKTYTILGGSTGALSDIIYFETAPDTPGIPRQIESVASTNGSVTVYWLPPSKPNGNIEYYLFNITKVVELEDLQNIDICNSIENRDKITDKLTEDESRKPSLLPPSQSSNNASQIQSESTSSICSRDGPNSDSDTKATLQVDKVTFQDLIIDIVYLKQPCINSSITNTSYNKTVKKRSIGYDVGVQDGTVSSNSLPRKPHSENSVQFESRVESQPANLQLNQLGFSNSPSVHPLSIKFNPLNSKTGAIVSAKSLKPGLGHTHQIEINGLEHFTKYTVEVVACHGEFVGNRAILSKAYKKCGLQAITQVRTQAIPEYDRILTDTIAFQSVNESVQENLVTWKKPEKPNGLVFAYRVRYRLKSSEHWTEVCINNTAYNRDGGFIMQDLLPGTYLFSVRAITMYSGIPFWSEETELEIPQNYLISPTILSVLVVITLAFLGLAVASGTYYYQKRKHELIYASVNPDYIQYEPDDWEVDRENVNLGSQIGTGAFGLVFKGQLLTEKGALNCAVKTIPPTSTAKQRMDFLREASIMKQFDTFHVVKLMGVVSASAPVYVIMEYMENGDLKDFLRTQREMHKLENKQLVDGIYLMAAQIADGMAYLASKKFIHRDLAARNCMVGENRIVKIGDFGLTRDVYANDYYRRDTQGRLPVKWMAPESLSDNMYTSASDVWSFGVVVWELVTFSASPYPGFSNDEVVKKVIGGYIMPRPANCPDLLFNIMIRCWRMRPKDRPTFETLVELLLPETEGKLYPNCFYKKSKANHAGDSIAHSIPEETNTGTESYPLLWFPQRANGLINGENHVTMNSSPISGSTMGEKDQL